jgi:hypothetical protein
VRGAEFHKGDGLLWPNTEHGPIASSAIQDVARWLGFSDTHLYLRRLPLERRAIFKRAKRPAKRPGKAGKPR